MKITTRKSLKASYSTHDMSVANYNVTGDNLEIKFNPGLIKITPPCDIVDGYVELENVDWDCSYAYIINLESRDWDFTGKKYRLDDFIEKFNGRKFNILSRQENREYGSMQKVLMYVHHHFREDPSLEEIASVAGLNSGYFSSVFHQFTGKTYKKYITELKMNYAKKLLLSGNLSVTEICYNSGYKTLSHFLREFKKFYGETPTEKRKIY